MDCKSYDKGGKMSVVEKLVNWERKKCIEVFFENGSDIKARVASLSNDTNEENNTVVWTLKLHPLKRNIA